MKRSGGDSKNGFTIIEVSLVLAIAGLIFLMVVLALPAVQRTEWDSRRQEDVAKLLDALKKYQTAHRGALPTGLPANGGELVVSFDPSYSSSNNSTWTGFYHDYLGNNFTDPRSGEQYKLRIKECTEGAPTANCGIEYPKTDEEENTILIVTQASCGGEGDKNYAIRSSNPRKVAAMYQMELGTVYCSNS